MGVAGKGFVSHAGRRKRVAFGDEEGRRLEVRLGPIVRRPGPREEVRRAPSEKRYAGLGISELRKLKGIVADLTLELRPASATLRVEAPRRRVTRQYSP